MRNRKLPLIASVLAAMFGASVVFACGWDFPWQLLDNRAATLDTMPVDSRSFAYAEAHLFPPPNDKLTTEEADYPDQDGMAQAVHAEVAGLASDQTGVVQQMRTEANGDSAFSKGAMLPVAVRLYTAGAVDFHKGDSAKAIARFRAILELPANERRDRAVWAAFMLGRLYAAKNNIAKASKSFALTRDLANKGAPDPLGLGVASFGEEARLHLKRAEALQKAKKMSPQQLREYGREISAAVRLYGEQAAHGSTIGIDSLRQVVDEVIGDDAAVAASICDPKVQQLLVTRTLDADAWARNYQETTPTSQISTLVTSVQKCGSGNITAADRLAAIAYRDGDYDLAHTLAIQMTTPLAMWVQARLAMQKGDVAEAAKCYAAASKAFPSSGDTNESDEGAKALLVGENGVLTLSRGEYVDALEQLYPYAETFWGDVAYIAERVLTVDELKTFVDTHKDTRLNSFVSLIDLATPSANSDDPTQPNRWNLEGGSGPADQLRGLLARRLVRAGRYREALNYAPPLDVQSAPAAAVPTVTSVAIASFGVLPTQSTRQSLAVSKPMRRRHRHRIRREPPEDAIAEYVQALNDANTARSNNVDRARDLYRAAAMAGDLKSGNRIMATEGPPDYYEDLSSYFGGIGKFVLPADDRFVTDGERQRFNASAPKPNFRYHYLFVGVDEAIHAADLLPPRSQAFAAVLCNATSWITDGTSCPVSASDLRRSPLGSEAPLDKSIRLTNARQTGYEPVREDLTCQLYQRYLKAGAVVPWATDFGHDCPEPDFDSAITFVQVQTMREARRRAQTIHRRWTVLFQLTLIALCLGASTWWFWRHRYA
ncbi:MAG TPA: hypothetical protein VKR28_11615 [Candidatus Binatus sp.]|nr:hypothetical protein [Candidatus Binatus sp.]